MIYNDDLAAFPVPEGMARAARKIDQSLLLLSNPVQGDGKTLFAITELAEGADTALSGDSWRWRSNSSWIRPMPMAADQRASAFLVVPTALKMTGGSC